MTLVAGSFNLMMVLFPMPKEQEKLRVREYWVADFFLKLNESS